MAGELGRRTILNNLFSFQALEVGLSPETPLGLCTLSFVNGAMVGQGVVAGWGEDM